MTDSASKIACQICGEEVHSIQKHLKGEHPAWTLEEYQNEYPDAPVLSPKALELIQKKRQQAGGRANMQTAENNVVSLDGATTKPLHELFDLGKAKAARNAKGDSIPITVQGSGNHDYLVPEVSSEHIWEIEALKNILMGLELNLPIYLWGHTGTGKTTALKQVCARTNRPFMRVQHSANMEESDVLGRWVVRNGETVFDLGPLALAMKHGWVYCADEYDFAFPNVLAVYQPVLEGEPLVIKDADDQNRIIKPNENFRFVATGNTNGAGDETGLYQGTNLQNAANYSRFNIVQKVGYMDKKAEIAMLKSKAGVAEDDAEKLIDFASALREAYEGGEMGMTVGPRELLAAATIGARKNNFRAGIQLAFTNKLSKVDYETAEQLAQRWLG